MSLTEPDFDVWADAIENFKSDKHERIQALINKYGWPLNGDDMDFKDSIEYDFIKPYLNEAKGTYRIAENALSATQSDGRHTANNDTSDERLLRKAAERLKDPDFEGLVPHIYLDTKGKITTGVGALVDDETTFKAVDWLVDNKRPATDAEMQTAYNHFQDLKRQEKFGQDYGANLFEKETNLRVPEAYAEQRAYDHLKDDLKTLRSEFKDFDSFDYPLKELLLDIAYQTGPITEEEWPKLRDGIRKRNLSKVYHNVNREDASTSRNKWAKERVKAIPAENGWHW